MRHMMSFVVFALLVSFAGQVDASKSVKKDQQKAQADAILEKKLVELGNLLDALQRVCNAVLQTQFKEDAAHYAQLGDYLSHYRATWMNNTANMFKTMDEIIKVMPASTLGKMDATNQGAIAAARKFIEEKGQAFFNKEWQGFASAEFDKKSATIQPKRNALISALSDKKMTVAVKKTLQNVLDILKLMYDATSGIRTDMYTLYKITYPHQPRIFLWEGVSGVNRWKEKGYDASQGEWGSWI